MSLERRRQEVGLQTSASRMDVKTRLLLQSLVQLLPDGLPPRQACPGNSCSLLLHTHTYTLQKKKKWSEFPPKGMADSVGEEDTQWLLGKDTDKYGEGDGPINSLRVLGSTPQAAR